MGPTLREGKRAAVPIRFEVSRYAIWYMLNAAMLSLLAHKNALMVSIGIFGVIWGLIQQETYSEGYPDKNTDLLRDKNLMKQIKKLVENTIHFQVIVAVFVMNFFN